MAVIKGVIIQRTTALNLEELCRAVQVQDELIIELIEQHLIQPCIGDAPDNWAFDDISLRRAKIAASFKRDLEMNLSGIALALELLDKIEYLENQLALLQHPYEK